MKAYTNPKHVTQFYKTLSLPKEDKLTHSLVFVNSTGLILHSHDATPYIPWWRTIIRLIALHSA